MLIRRNLYKNLKGLKLNESTLKIYLIKQQPLFRSQSTVTSAITNDVDTAQKEWENAKSFDEIPTMNTFTMMKNFFPGGKYSKLDPTQLMLAFKDDLGSIAKIKGYFGRKDTIITHNVEDFEKVLRNEGIWPIRPGLEFLHYHRSVYRADFFQGVEGIISTYGEKWANFRSAVNPVLMHPKNARLYMHKMSEVNKEFIERIREIRDPQTLEVPDNFEEEMNRWTLESISVVALDQQLGTITRNRNNPLAKELFKAIIDFFEYAKDIEYKPSTWKYYKNSAFKKLMKSLDSIMEVTSAYVNEAIERIEEDRKNGVPEKSDSEKSVLEKLIKIDKKIATVMAMDMLMAGVDTTSSTFAGILLCLAKNPEKQSKLREEVIRILPQKDSEFDANALQNIPYLKACIKEALRVYPINVGNARVPVKDVVLSGYRVPKGTQVSMIPISLLNDDKHYPRANEYLPERWLRASKDNETVTEECPHSLKASSPFIYLPFGFGPRSCIGRRIVDMELELGIARVIRNFNIEFNYPTHNAFKSLLINVPNIPMKFKFTDVIN